MLQIDELIRTRRKSIALIVERDGRLIVRAPLRAREEAIHRFIRQKEDWIRRTREKLRAQRAAFRPRRFVEGETFLVMGESRILQLVEQGKPELCLAQDGFRLSKSALPVAPLVFKRWYQRQARQLLSQRAAALAQQHGYSYKKIRISSARTRWGSCSSKGTLSFAWRLVMAPLPVIDYVVLHELAHLKIRSHARQFWERMEEMDPQYRAHKKWLDQNGYLLNLE
jgi:predicted metal-dependent hydrolase